MPLEDLSRSSRIGLQYLEALERNEFESLPGPRAFGKLYIRAYAEILGFDPEPLIAEYDQERYRRIREARERPAEPVEEPAAEIEEESMVTEPEQPLPTAAAEPVAVPRRRGLWMVAVVLSVVAVWVVIRLLSADESPSPAVQQALPVPQPAMSIPEVVESSDPEPEASEPTPPPLPNSHLSVTDTGLGLGIRNHRVRETTTDFEEGQVAWFTTRVEGGTRGEVVRHVWLRGGGWVQTIELGLGSASWRTRSSKTLWGTGDWSVEARDVEGNVLARAEFSVHSRG